MCELHPPCCAGFTHIARRNIFTLHYASSSFTCPEGKACVNCCAISYFAIDAISSSVFVNFVNTVCGCNFSCYPDKACPEGCFVLHRRCTSCAISTPKGGFVWVATEVATTYCVNEVNKDTAADSINSKDNAKVHRATKLSMELIQQLIDQAMPAEYWSCVLQDTDSIS